MSKKNLIIVVNYNQAVEIENFLSKLRQYFSVDRVVIVDDGSTDGSDTLAEKQGFKIVRHVKNLGIGAAIRSGLKFADREGFDGVLISSSNGKMDPADFRMLLDQLDDGRYDYIQGSRFLKSQTVDLPPFRRLMIPILSVFWSVIFRQKMTDITCGLRAYPLKLVRDSRIKLEQDWLNRYELEYYLHIKFLTVLKAKMLEVPVTISYSHLQPKRVSKIKPFSGWWSMARPFVFLFLRIKH